MRLIFMGSPEYSIPSLEGLLDSKHQVIAVITQPDKRQGRGHKLMPCPLKEFALKKNLKVFTYDKVSRDGIEDIKKLAPDIIITVAYGQILSGELLSLPKFGVINAHASILPKYRGASPISAAIENGDRETGVTIMQTAVGLDTGDIILVRRTEIGEYETTGELSIRLAKISSEALIAALELIEKGKTMPKIQSDSDSSICKKLSKVDAIINWNQIARRIKCQVLSQNPFPISRTILNGEQMKIYRAKIDTTLDNSNESVGTIVAPTSPKKGLFVQTGAGIIEILEASFPGKKAMSGKDIVIGNKAKVGMRFETFPYGNAEEIDGENNENKESK